MGKEEKCEPQGCAFARMNYLYQAAHLISQTSSDSPLSNYYAKLMKEISKKVVEKLHPDLKRTLCPACNYCLTADNSHINVKIKPVRKKQKKKKKIKTKNLSKTDVVKVWKEAVKVSNNNSDSRYNKCRIQMRNKKPNKVQWSCSKCGFSKRLLLKPDYKIWVHKFVEEKIN